MRSKERTLLEADIQGRAEELQGGQGKMGQGQRKWRHEYRCLLRNKIKENDKVELVMRSFVKGRQYLSMFIG